MSSWSCSCSLSRITAWRAWSSADLPSIAWRMFCSKRSLSDSWMTWSTAFLSRETEGASSRPQTPSPTSTDGCWGSMIASKWLWLTWSSRIGADDLADVAWKMSSGRRRSSGRLWLEHLDRATEHLRHRLDLDVSSMAPVFSHCTEAFVDVLSWDEVLDVLLIVFLSREQQGEMKVFFLNNGNQKQHRAAR